MICWYKKCLQFIVAAVSATEVDAVSDSDATEEMASDTLSKVPEASEAPGKYLVGASAKPNAPK